MPFSVSNNSPAWTYQSIVFDLDGVLIDSEPIFEEAATRLLARRGLQFKPEVAHGMMGTPARQAFAYFREFYRLDESIEVLAAESSKDFYAVLGSSPIPLMPGVAPFLARLAKKKIPLAIATSSSRRYLERVFAPHGLLDHFGFVLTCEDVIIGKPDPEVYKKAARRLGHSPEAMVVLEDSVHGVTAAKAAGARCIAVPHERVPRAGLKAADLIVAGLEDPILFAKLGVNGD